MKLSACPFCGHIPQDIRDCLHPSGIGWIITDGRRHYVGRTHKLYNDRMGDCWDMGCLVHEGGCSATITGDTKSETVTKWNRRPS